MDNLQFHSPHFITYLDDLLTIDILGGVDLQQIERMISTLRITYQNYPPFRSTLDLYNDHQTDKLIHSLCDKYNLALLDVSKSVHRMIAQLESYKLERLKYPKKNPQEFTLDQDEQKEATGFLKQKNLLASLTKKLNTIGIIGEDDNALILLLTMASHKFNNPFSVICLAKSGIGKSYILQKLSECMPQGTYSFHSRISPNALYYFDSHQLDHKVLFIEDMEWTSAMLSPLATLQSQGRLINTRATKDKDGMLHSTTFEVRGKLCLIACAYSENTTQTDSLPFLYLHLNHTSTQDAAIMDYQKRIRTGNVKQEDAESAKHLLKCVLASLENVGIINPYATLIDLPQDVAHPRKSLVLLLNFIEVITYFFQAQREQVADEETGEVFIKTHPDDIELAFKLLKNNLFRRADELSTSARGFYSWLTKFLHEAKTDQFTALDLRRAKAIHPRTLNRYLQELKLFNYVQVTGGNKHREGYRYKLTHFDNQGQKQDKITQSINQTLKAVWDAYNKENGITEPEKDRGKSQAPEPLKNEHPPEGEPAQVQPTPPLNGRAEGNHKHKKRVRIKEKEQHTFKLLLELEAKQPGREYLPTDFTTITGRHHTTEARHLKTLVEQGKLERQWRNRQYYYRLKSSSKTVSQLPVSNPENLNAQAKNSRTTPK